MAGFDFKVSARADERALLRELLTYLQRRGRESRLQIRFRWHGDGYRATCDGPLKQVQLLEARVAAAVLARAEALGSYGSREPRLLLAARLVVAWRKGVEKISSAVAELAAMVGGIPGSFYFDVEKGDHLSQQLEALTQVAVLFEHSHLESSEAIETAHTTVELVSKAILGGASGGRSFAGMIREVERLGALPAEYASNLIELKDVRKLAKHRSRRVPHDEAVGLLKRAVEAVHYLLCFRALQRRQTPNPSVERTR